jgi:LmbE family N-acetylglucosaminyl deacetylase
VVSGPGSILAVMAHPDDAELWAGGTLALHARHEQAVVAVEGQDEQRAAEAAEGAHRLGVELTVTDVITPAWCAGLLLELRPEVVVTHRLDDVHPDHRRVADAVLAAIPEAVIAAGRPLRLYTCDSYESLTLGGQVSGRTIVDVSTTFETKMHALQAHASQPLDHFGAMAERLARTWGARIGAAFGEAFDPVPVLGRMPGAFHL